MPAAKKPKNEKVRLQSLQSLNVLDSGEEGEFNAIVQAASLVCGVPMSFISLVDADRQWFKAGVGLPGVTETSRDVAFCAHAIHQDGLFEVEDATLDPRFSDNPLVNDDPHICFYAGATLTLSDGTNAGTLCVIDSKPRRLNDTQRAILKQLAIVVTKALEQRRVSKNEKRLTEQNTYVTSILEQSNDAIISLTTDGIVTYWNNAAELMFGYQASEVVGGSLKKLIVKSEENEAAFEKLLKGIEEGFRYDGVHYHQDGRAIAVSVSLSPTFDPEGNLVGATKIVRDITDQKRSDQLLLERTLAIKEQERLTDQMIEGQGVATFMIDAQHIVVKWNKACEILTGVMAEDVLGKAEAWKGFYRASRPTLADLVVDNHKQKVADYYPIEGPSELAGSGWHAETWFTDLSGARRYIIFDATTIKDTSGKVIGALETLQDITKDKLIEQAFKEERESLALIIEGTRAGTWHWNHITNEYSFNKIWAEMLGYTLKALEPQNVETWKKLIHDDDNDTITKKLDKHFSGESDMYEAEFRMRHLSGHWVWVLARGRVLSWLKNGQPEWLHGTHTDITERKTLEIDLQQAYNNLEEFTSVASHDLKSPLRGIADLVEWIHEDLGTDVEESVKHNLNRVQLRVKRMEALIDDLLQYSRSGKTSEETQLIDPNAILTEVLNGLEIPPSFNVSTTGKVKPFTSYETPLRTVLRNLLSNAVQHHDKEGGNIELTIALKKEFVVFEIKDDGPGIAKAVQERVFKLFQALSKSKEASGIGLAVSKRMAEAHGGYIELESDEGAGALFRVWWPKIQSHSI